MHRRARRRLLAASLAAVAFTGADLTSTTLASTAHPTVTRKAPFMRGVVVTCPRAGQIWGTEAMSEALGEIRSLGAEWVAIHPYAWLPTDGAIRSRPAAEVGYLTQAVARMRAAGVKIFWKPHLGYWGSFDWRGAIEFGNDEATWQRFFASYREFIVDQARFAAAHDVELFAIGIEYERTMHREADWRAVIASVREVYDGRITYAANWDGLEKVPFWDAIDIIGVHAYFPLSNETEPAHETLTAGWNGHLENLQQLAERFDRPIVFAEIGYNRSPAAARAPWEYGSTDTPANRELRRELMEVALERIERESHIVGMFWWKWMPGNHHGRDFSLREPEAQEALSRYWAPPPPTTAPGAGH